jgi:hypothetical protein
MDRPPRLIRNITLPPPAYCPIFPSSCLTIRSVHENISTGKYVITFASDKGFGLVNIGQRVGTTSQLNETAACDSPVLGVACFTMASLGFLLMKVISAPFLCRHC